MVDQLGTVVPLDPGSWKGSGRNIGDRHGFRLRRLLIPGMALLIQDSVAGSVLAAIGSITPSTLMT
jgi:hypothetical protein